MADMHVRLGDDEITLRSGENLLDACIRQAISISFSCRGGVCQTCLLRCTHGDVPEQAQRGLSDELREKGYLLACQCRPAGYMELERPLAGDRVNACVLHGCSPSGPFHLIRLETLRAMETMPGKRLRLRTNDTSGLLLEITRSWPDEMILECLLRLAPGEQLPGWLERNEIGFEFEVVGPLDGAAGDVGVPDREAGHAAPDPELWVELGEGTVVRAVLVDFYRQVYADARLAPFFQRVTMDRSIDKQYSFMRQLMTGEKVYFGDRPRNAHHWMVIPDEIFDYRQSLMQGTLASHGLTDAQIARWTRFEVHFRGDIVKSAPWPRRVHGEDQPVEGYDRAVLTEGTVCDHCQAEVAAGIEVTYHVRLGQISCPSCLAVEARAATAR